MAPPTSPSVQWADLPANLLRDISGRLHATSDAVRFHGVCRSWCNAPKSKRGLLPWLVAPSVIADSATEDQCCRCVFSKASYSAPGVCVRDTRVARTDGTAAWLLGADLSLVNPLNAQPLPFPRERLDRKWLDHRHRVVSDDGAVLLYDFRPEEGNPRSRFRASFLRPDHGEWQRVTSNLDTDRCCAAAYYYGYIVCVGLASCHILWPRWDQITNEVQAALPDEPGKVRRCSYLFESGGDLLLASVLQHDSGTDLSVSLHQLCLRNGGEGEEERVVEWVRDDESDFHDAVLFLGFPGSFPVDAVWFGGELSGGTAYFVIDNTAGHDGRSGPLEPCSVYRYNFKDGAATLVETLPAGWHNTRCLWFLPDPQIPVLPEPTTRCQRGTPTTRNDSTTQSQSQQLTIYVGDLSPKVDSSRLRDMFSKHGKVARARVVYDKRGRSRRFGFVTMATRKGFNNAMAACNAVQ
ncbi:hypothetical protein VPH35_131726 [Triticum aestivum]